jgi:hypothetical protein
MALQSDIYQSLFLEPNLIITHLLTPSRGKSGREEI